MSEKKTDMQTFIDHYEPSKFKQLKNGIEIRGVQNVDDARIKAASLINSLSLGLVVVRDAESACRSAFEVREVAA